MGGNGLFKASAFGPKNGTELPETEEGKRAFVEERIVELQKKGGWFEGIDKADESLPVWLRRGFDWTWRDNGDLEVVHRVAGMFIHLPLSFLLFQKTLDCEVTDVGVRHPRAPDAEEGIHLQRMALPFHFFFFLIFNQLRITYERL